MDQTSVDAMIESVKNEHERAGMKKFMSKLGEDLVNATDICSAGKIGLTYLLELVDDDS